MASLSGGSGLILQSLYAETATVISCAGIPEDNTIPQNTEGTEILTLSVDVKSASNKLKISGVVNGATNTTGNICVAIFKDGVADALFATSSSNTDASKAITIPFNYVFTPAVVGNIDIKIRSGSGSGTFYTNADRLGNRLFGGVALCNLVIEEIKA